MLTCLLCQLSASLTEVSVHAGMRCCKYPGFFMNVIDWPKLRSSSKYLWLSENCSWNTHTHTFSHFSLSPCSLSLPSSTSSLKVQSVLSFPTTELPRGCGRSALSITLSSGKYRSALMVGVLPVQWASRQRKHFHSYGFHQVCAHSTSLYNGLWNMRWPFCSGCLFHGNLDFATWSWFSFTRSSGDTRWHVTEGLKTETHYVACMQEAPTCSLKVLRFKWMMNRAVSWIRLKSLK